ncbi:MAG: transglycosylase domain-containing protein, partial [Myxococcota bacterium]
TVRLDRASLFSGDTVIDSVSLQGVEVILTERAEGGFDVEEILRRLKSSRSRPKRHPGAVEKDPDERKLPRVFRYFGDSYPSVRLEQMRVRLEHERASSSFPLSELTVPMATVVSAGASAEISAEVHLVARPSEDFVFPTRVDITGSAQTPIDQSSLHIALDRPVRVRNLSRLPFVELQAKDVRVGAGQAVTVTDVALRATYSGAASAPLFEAASVKLQPKRWRSDPKVMLLEGVRELALERPIVRVTMSARGGSELADLFYAWSSPHATQVHKNARRVAARIDRASKRKAEREARKGEPKPEVDPVAKEDAEKAKKKRPKRGPLERLAKLLKRVDLFAPQIVKITDAALLVRDERKLLLTRRAERVQLVDGQLTLERDRDNGSIVMRGGFRALANDHEERGEIDVDVTLHTLTQGGKISVTVPELDLNWVAQMAGEDLARTLRGGTLRAKLEASRAPESERLHFEGDVSVEDGDMYLPKIAEAPLRDFTAGYTFSGYYDPTQPVPAPKLVSIDPEQELEGRGRLAVSPPTEGALVFTRGEGRLGAIRATLRPSVYGFASDRPLPARLDLRLLLPPTDAQAAFDSIPDAVWGELVGAEMTGVVQWDMELELPMYRASKMEWTGEPEVTDFKLLSLPRAVDVRQLTERFRHTIVDEGVAYQRDVTIPEMRPTPDNWLVDHAGLDREKIDEHWRRGGWFDDSPWSQGGTPQQIEDPSRWSSRSVAARPWLVGGVGAPVERMWRPYRRTRSSKPQPMISAPYGSYHFVPLHHVSPWVVRALLTNEDSGFFSHDGFNRRALRESIERNLVKGDYARGASTISMQTIKNLYLTRTKVLARKVQEAFLVWLMEEVIKVPKARILEVYLNIIEFAPGVFGIHDAAVHYFGKRPDELTAAEAVFLVSIVPGPKRWHFYWERGEVSDQYFLRVQRLMRSMVHRNRMTQEQYEQATKPEFYKPGPDDPPLKPIAPTLPDPFDTPTPELTPVVVPLFD